MKKHLLSLFSLIIYYAILIKVIVFKDIPAIRIGHLILKFGGTESGYPANFVPFKTILPYLLGYKGWIIAGINLAGNIGLLVPVGLLVPLIFRNMTWKKALLVAVTSGLAIETMQSLLHVGIFDIDDVILNALGVMIGYGAFAMVARWIRLKEYKKICIATAVAVVILLGALYWVYPKGRTITPNMMAGINRLDASTREQEGAVPQSGDLCGGTGGTGEIISMANGIIDIRRKDGVVQTITLTAQTDIRNSSGHIAASDLKVSDHVTVVTMDEKRTATTVLVCAVTK